MYGAKIGVYGAQAGVYRVLVPYVLVHVLWQHC